MNTPLRISKILYLAWQHTKSQIWILAGLYIAFFICVFILSLLLFNQSVWGYISSSAVEIILSLVFVLGYIKNCFLTIDGEEPQFAAFGQQAHKIVNMFLAYILCFIAISIGFVLFIIPGFYLILRLQFAGAAIVDRDCDAMEAIQYSWKITQGNVWNLLGIALSMIGFMILGAILFGIGIFVAVPYNYIIYCSTYRKLNQQAEQNESYQTTNQISTDESTI